MTEQEFEASLLRDGYTPRRASYPPNHVATEHAHGFDARVMVLEGEITITRGGKPRTFRPGEWCEVPAGEPHEERVGPQGVSYLGGRRAAS
ncbi:MAG TPA: cupin domain-containing protein [Acetobacteraceae bacterium]|nr:cupin domain-containing protein [Acetobacteraceae bacterium]